MIVPNNVSIDGSHVCICGFTGQLYPSFREDYNPRLKAGSANPISEVRLVPSVRHDLYSAKSPPSVKLEEDAVGEENGRGAPSVDLGGLWKFGLGVDCFCLDRSLRGII